MKILAIKLIILLAIYCGFSCNPKPDNNKNISTIYKKAVVDNTNYQQGKLIFEKFCNTCHFAPEKNVLDQYIFDNLFERLPSPPEQYFVKYIQDSKALKYSGDKYAMKVAIVRNPEYEHYFKDSLSQQAFGDLIIYIKEAAKLKSQ